MLRLLLKICLRQRTRMTGICLLATVRTVPIITAGIQPRSITLPIMTVQREALIVILILIHESPHIDMLQVLAPVEFLNADGGQVDVVGAWSFSSRCVGRIRDGDERRAVGGRARGWEGRGTFPGREDASTRRAWSACQDGRCVCMAVAAAVAIAAPQLLPLRRLAAAAAARGARGGYRRRREEHLVVVIVVPFGVHHPTDVEAAVAVDGTVIIIISNPITLLILLILVEALQLDLQV